MICVTHAFGIISFAKQFKDEKYDGRWDYCCISACRLSSPEGGEILLSSYKKHVEDILIDYMLHKKKKEEEAKKPE